MNRVHVALFLSIPVFTLLTPTVKENISAFFVKSTLVSAFQGDGILVADSDKYSFQFPWFPFTSITWKLTQQPLFGDAYHTISFFVVPEQKAYRFLYRYNSSYTSNHFFVDGGKESVRDGLQHLNLRSNIYLLPKQYTGPRKEARAEFKVQFTQLFNSSSYSVGACSPVCQFQNRFGYSNFLNMETDSIDNAIGCEPPFVTNAFKTCEFNEKSDVFMSEVNSYNFFSALVPTKSNVHFKTNIDMFFYNQTKLARHFKCQIHGVNTCSFKTLQSFPRERFLIIAYTHPNSFASELTTTISVEAEITVHIWQTAAYFLVLLLTPCLLIKTLFL